LPPLISFVEIGKLAIENQGLYENFERKLMNSNDKLKEAATRNERNLTNLVNGVKKPKTDKDKCLAADIEKIRKLGGIIEIPYD
jgi:hypothetical protein